MTPKPSQRLENSSCPVPWPLLLLLCAGLVFCSGDTLTQPEVRDSGKASVAISLGKVIATILSRVEVVITGSDMDEIRQDLTIDGNRATGTVRGIPAGSDRLFTLNGYDSSGILAYTGSASADVIAGEQVTVRITMRRVGTAAGKPQLRVADSASAQRGIYASGLYRRNDITRVTGEMENTGDADATNVVMDLRGRNVSGAVISDSRDTVGTVKAGKSKLFTADFSGTSEYSWDTGTYLSLVDYTLSYNEGDPISGSITIPE